MKIATWNVERLKHKAKLEEIIQISTEIQADIFIFTETDKQVEEFQRLAETGLLLCIYVTILEFW